MELYDDIMEKKNTIFNQELGNNVKGQQSSWDIHNLLFEYVFI